ncbi:endonuclease/exonuclease/phosphatase family protein [Hanstruepera ponticola]|uniref:endonuclease/exonuclease/phosphatase family protein n=1 Tax=Hanstruepera ponticola TaxID=2042995 RepID=UPI0017853ECA|nr:endonuclease/exonuclease/phosphatase family protein [Hanstruepera ponticola]
MKRKIQYIWFIAILNITGLFAQETFNVMFYNLLNFPLEDAVPNRLQYLETILDDYQPDVFMVCELNNESGANSILNLIQNTINPNFEKANFTLNSSDDTIGNQNDLQNLLYYDSSKFILESQNIVTTIFRDFNHYRLKLNTINQDTEPIFIDFIVCHLKASSGEDNQELRLEMVEDLIIYLENFPADSNVILAGDFNVYTSSEPAFQRLIDNTNNIVFIDPANQIGSWHNNTNYIDVFTQSTRTQTGMGGTTGGFDDRFDFIMCSENMINDTDVYYASDSYQAYGNNGNIDCYNNAINDTECDGATFSFEIRDALHNFSDHLPVTLQIETTETLLSTPEHNNGSLFEIVGTNIVKSNIRVKFNNQSNHTKRLIIYDVLGHTVKTVAINSSYEYTIPIAGLSSGIYYIMPFNTHVEPLKFVKIN